ncbi:hypothetical protein PVAP13_7NG025800 [Panicum virgatum]|uniref:Uncharacterized protein n=1 Tax=Panicum virgatum TaxID=38727 RepID=A0A8T0PYY0_PANVG|nr:hypothetical protein PVAP13_7NG025800 [Panicum virgatum]KAG2565549.1 hypothetical protein PVAP13_7NG025800 [Panicum virgatum]
MECRRPSPRAATSRVAPARTVSFGGGPPFGFFMSTPPLNRTLFQASAPASAAAQSGGCRVVMPSKVTEEISSSDESRGPSDCRSWTPQFLHRSSYGPAVRFF